MKHKVAQLKTEITINQIKAQGEQRRKNKKQNNSLILHNLCYEPQQRKNLLELFQKNPPVKITCRQRGSLQLAFLQQMKNSKSKKKLKSRELLQNSPIIHLFPLVIWQQ